MLEAGIEATKYNYSNRESRDVRITLTNNRTCLTYKTIGGKNCSLLGCKSRKVRLSDFQTLIYGGTTSTFKIHLQKDKKVTRKQKTCDTKLNKTQKLGVVMMDSYFFSNNENAGDFYPW